MTVLRMSGGCVENDGDCVGRGVGEGSGDCVEGERWLCVEGEW